jgi:hypothetical protein
MGTKSGKTVVEQKELLKERRKVVDLDGKSVD